MIIYLVVELGLGQLLLLDVLGVVQDLRVLAVLGDELDEGADKGANGAPVARQDGFVLQDRRYLEMKVWYSSLEMKGYDILEVKSICFRWQNRSLKLDHISPLKIYFLNWPISHIG